MFGLAKTQGQSPELPHFKHGCSLRECLGVFFTLPLLRLVSHSEELKRCLTNGTEQQDNPYNGLTLTEHFPAKLGPTKTRPMLLRRRQNLDRLHSGVAPSMYVTLVSCVRAPRATRMLQQRPLRSIISIIRVCTTHDINRRRAACVLLFLQGIVSLN